jgi:hypothetical protein
MLCAAAAVLGAGCEHAAPPTTQPAGAPARPRLSLLAPGHAAWSLPEAAIRLAVPDLRVSAAVRIVRASGAQPACVPAELTDRLVERLRVKSLGDAGWALGIRDPREERVLHAPVLLGRAGQVFLFADGVAEELTRLYQSPDADLFPHLVIAPAHVTVVDDPPRLALVRARPDEVVFGLRRERGYPYVAALFAQSAKWVEIARYAWEPYELAFAGPVAEHLPEPPGGLFELNLEQSELLIPVGGVLPDQAPLPNAPPPRMPERAPGEV